MSTSTNHTTAIREATEPMTTATFTPEMTSHLPHLNGQSFRVTGVTGVSDEAGAMYMCNDCDFLHDSLQSVISHRRAHARKTTSRPTAEQITEALAVLTRAVTSPAPNAAADKDAIRRQARRAQEWKTRALAAEKTLAQLRAALKASGAV